MTQVAAWLNEDDKDFLAILATTLLEHPEYRFRVREETLCIVRVQ